MENNYEMVSHRFEPHIYYYEGTYHLYYVYNSWRMRKMVSNHASGPYIQESSVLNTDHIPPEGPNLVKLINQEKWLLLTDAHMDGYMSLRETTDLNTFSSLEYGIDYSFNGLARTGTIIQITQAEYDALREAFPNSPVPEEPSGNREAYSFERVPLGTDFLTDSEYGSGRDREGQAGTHYDAEITAFGNGRALQWTTRRAGANLTVGSDSYVTLYTGSDGAAADWTGAKELKFYVDASSYGDTVTQPSIGLRLITADDVLWAPVCGSAVYIRGDQEEQWSTLRVLGGNNVGASIQLPAGFKGWIRISLAAENWNLAANYGDGTFSSSPQIQGIGLTAGGRFSNAAFVNTSIFFDSLSLLMEVSGPGNNDDVPSDISSDVSSDVSSNVPSGVPTGVPFSALVSLALIPMGCVVLRCTRKKRY